MKPVDFRKLVSEKLGNTISEEKMSLLPSGFQKIGSIVIINLPEELHEYSKLIGRLVLMNYPNVKTVTRNNGVGGELRKPEIEIIAGEKTTETKCRLMIRPRPQVKQLDRYTPMVGQE